MLTSLGNWRIYGFRCFQCGDSGHTFKRCEVRLSHLRSHSSSEIVPGVRLFVACRLTIEMRSRFQSLVADVTEGFLALFAFNQVFAASFPIDTATRRALAAHLNVHVRVFLHSDVPLNHFKGDFDGLQMSLIRPVIRVLLVVFLALGLLSADPAEPLPALGALHLRAATTDESDGGPALRIWTPFAALLEVNVI